MKKDLSYVCDYYRALIAPVVSDGFTVAKKFKHGLTDDELRKGMIAFRDFLYDLFDIISANKDKIDTGSKYDPYGTPGDRGTACIKEQFPVFFDLTIILLSLGFHGRLVTEPKIKLVILGEDLLTVIDPITEKYQSLIRMSSSRKSEMFGLLSDAGLRFNGDFSWEADFTEIMIFDVTHKDSKYFPIGLKLIAGAMINNKNYYKLENLFASILMRGDFNPVANEIPKNHTININDYANSQLPEIKEWIADIDTYLLSNKCKQIQSMGGGSSFTYTKRNTNITHGTVCTINMGITGSFIVPGVNHLANHNNIVPMLPSHMINTLKKCCQISGNFNPEQCYRRAGNMSMARYTFTYKGKEYEGCRHAGLRCQYSGVRCCFSGFIFDLSEPAVRNIMSKWIEMEIDNHNLYNGRL